MLRNFSHKLLVFIFCSASGYGLFAQSLPENPDIHEFSGPMQFLSSEMLHGRETGTESAGIAAHFMAASIQSYGLQPAGDKSSGKPGFLEKFEVIRYETDSAKLVFFQGKNQLDLIDRIDFKADPYLNDISAGGQMVFAGYGIVDEQTRKDDFAGLDLDEKIVLVLDRLPGWSDTLSSSWKIFRRFGNEEDSLLLTKLQHAAAGGASAMVLIGRGASGEEEYYTDAGHYIKVDPPASTIPLFRLTESGYDKLVGFLGFDVASYEKKAAINPEIPLLKLPSSEARMLAKTNSQDLEAFNVLGLIRGRDTSRSIVVGAHYDHLGQRGDSIYYGADDNASGTAGVLSLAKNWSESSSAPAYNLIFAFWSAEEKGMLGSTFHVINDQLNNTNTVAYLNFDMISRKDATDSTQISIGLLTGTDEIERMAVEENAKLPLPFRLDLWHTNGQGGSDYVPFAKRKIPVMSFFSGYHKDYHTPRDVFEKTDPNRMKSILQLGNQCLIRLALTGE